MRSWTGRSTSSWRSARAAAGNGGAGPAATRLSYYRGAARTWSVLQSLRRLDRFWQRRIRRRPNPFLFASIGRLTAPSPRASRDLREAGPGGARGRGAGDVHEALETIRLDGDDVRDLVALRAQGVVDSFGGHERHAGGAAREVLERRS